MERRSFFKVIMSGVALLSAPSLFAKESIKSDGYIWESDKFRYKDIIITNVQSPTMTKLDSKGEEYETLCYGAYMYGPDISVDELKKHLHRAILPQCIHKAVNSNSYNVVIEWRRMPEITHKIDDETGKSIISVTARYSVYEA